MTYTTPPRVERAFEQVDELKTSALRWAVPMRSAIHLQEHICEVVICSAMRYRLAEVVPRVRVLFALISNGLADGGIVQC